MASSDYVFYHNEPDDTIWWVEYPMPMDGVWLFSFDKKQVFNMFSDYPWKLTPEQVEIFDRENPYWADFFRDRKGVKKDGV